MAWILVRDFTQKKQFITFYIFFIEYTNNNNNNNNNNDNDNNNNTVLINSLKGFSAYFTILNDKSRNIY